MPTPGRRVRPAARSGALGPAAFVEALPGSSLIERPDPAAALSAPLSSRGTEVPMFVAFWFASARDVMVFSDQNGESRVSLTNSRPAAGHQPGRLATQESTAVAVAGDPQRSREATRAAVPGLAREGRTCATGAADHGPCPASGFRRPIGACLPKSSPAARPCLGRAAGASPPSRDGHGSVGLQPCRPSPVDPHARTRSPDAPSVAAS
jgi:hypothetical protein